MTVLYSDIVNEVLIDLQGYTMQQDRATTLSAAITSSTATSISVSNTSDIGKGIIEIGEELMWVESFDRVGNTLTISPWGRGYLGTTAGSSYAANSKITISPTFPKYVVKRAINDTIQAIGAAMHTVRQITFIYNPSITTYELLDSSSNNVTAHAIIAAHWQEVGPTKEWLPIRRIDLESYADIATWGGSSAVPPQTVTIRDYITPGRTVKLLYAADPTPFDADADVFTTKTGLPLTCKDVVVLGAIYRLLTFLDPARASQISPQADEIDSKRPFGSVGNVMRQIFALYTTRLNEEAKKQLQKYPPRVHYVR